MRAAPLGDSPNSDTETSLWYMAPPGPMDSQPYERGITQPLRRRRDKDIPAGRARLPSGWVTGGPAGLAPPRRLRTSVFLVAVALSCPCRLYRCGRRDRVPGSQRGRLAPNGRQVGTGNNKERAVVLQGKKWPAAVPKGLSPALRSISSGSGQRAGRDAARKEYGAAAGPALSP